MGRLQVRVALVQAVLDAVAVEGVALHPELVGHRGGPVAARLDDAVLVDVVAQVEHHVGALGGEVAVGGVEAVLPGRARGERHEQVAGVRLRLRRRLGTADGADLRAGAEAVEVLPGGLEAAHVDVHRVPVLGGGPRGAAADAAGERLVLGQLPLDLQPAVGHAAEGFERPGGQAGPEHDAVGQRVARRDAELEGVVRRPGGRGARRPRVGQAGGEGQCQRGTGEAEEVAARRAAERVGEPPIVVHVSPRGGMGGSRSATAHTFIKIYVFLTSLNYKLRMNNHMARSAATSAR